MSAIFGYDMNSTTLRWAVTTMAIVTRSVSFGTYGLADKFLFLSPCNGLLCTLLGFYHCVAQISTS